MVCYGYWVSELFCCQCNITFRNTNFFEFFLLWDGYLSNSVASVILVLKHIFFWILCCGINTRSLSYSVVSVIRSITFQNINFFWCGMDTWVSEEFCCQHNITFQNTICFEFFWCGMDTWVSEKFCCQCVITFQNTVFWILWCGMDTGSLSDSVVTGQCNIIF